MYTYLRSCLFGVCFALYTAFLPVSVTAAATQQAEAKKVPTAIKADRMEYNADGQVVVFNGNVYVKRPDFELWSVKLTVYLDKSGKKSDETEAAGAAGMQAGDIDRIVAEKDVRMKSNEKEGTCQKATYYVKTDKFVMEGSPLLKDKDKNNIGGTVITHYLKANRSDVQKPIATFYTQDKTENSLEPGSKPKGNKGSK